MDWMDEYLYSMGQYRTTVSPADTHVWGVKPKLNNIQQKMLFDAAAQSELEYRLIVQESREAEIDAGMGGGYDAGSAAREKRPVTPPVPSGIPVASTASVIVAGFAGGNTQYNGTYNKATIGVYDPTILTPPTDGEFYIKGLSSFVVLPPSVTIGGSNYYDGDDYSYSFAPQGNWTISRINDDGEGATSLLVIASNASSNNSSIPTTGWSPSITITAA